MACCRSFLPRGRRAVPRKETLSGQKRRRAVQTESWQRCLQRCYPVHGSRKMLIFFFLKKTFPILSLTSVGRCCNFNMYPSGTFPTIQSHRIQETIFFRARNVPRCNLYKRCATIVACFRGSKQSGVHPAWRSIWKNKLVIGSGLWKTVINLLARRKWSHSWWLTSPSALRRTGWLVETATVSKEACSVTVSRIAMTALMKTPVVS